MKLLFIVSQPRSGSTFLQALLSNNDYVDTSSESWLLLPFLSYNNSEVNKSLYNSTFCSEAIDDFIETKVRKEIFEEKLRFFLNSVYEEVSPDKLFIDKTPRYYEILPAIKSTFPDANILILLRHPFDVLNSIINTWDVNSYEHLAEYFNRDLLSAPKLMDRFLLENAKNERVKKLYYEDLIKNTNKELESIFSWLSIPVDKIETNFEENTKFQGKFGDPFINKTEKKPQKGNYNKWEYLLHDKKWKDIVLGYGGFLNHQNLEILNYYSLPEKMNRKFNYFKVLADAPELIHSSDKRLLWLILKRKLYKFL